MKHLSLLLLLALMSSCATAPRTGSAPAARERGTFVHVAGRDTTGVEHFVWSDGRLEGDLRFRTSAWHTYALEFADDAQSSSFHVTVRSPFAPADYPPTQVNRIAFQGDSAYETISRNGQVTEHRRFSGRRAVPLLYPSLALLEVATRRARRLGDTASHVPFVETGTYGQRQFTVAISWLGPDSAVLNLGGTEFRLALDSEGRVLGGWVPSRNLFIERVAARVELRAPDYSAPSGAAYTAETVRIATPGGHVAVGTLTRPKYTSEPVPVAVIISGSGPQDRDGVIPGIGGYRPFRQIAEVLADRGIALLRYDDRGIGGSTAGEGRTTADLAEDVRSIISFLRTRNDIDANRIALLGHSEGGLIAPMIAASDPSLRSIVLMAAPAWTGRKVLDSQLRAQLGTNAALTEAQRDSMATQRLAQIEATAAPWMRFFLDYDPLETARRTSIPVLLLQGATDRQVTVEQAEELAAAFRAGGNRDVSIHVLPGVNHLFLDDQDGHTRGYQRLPSGDLSREMLRHLSEWLSARLSGSPER